LVCRAACMSCAVVCGCAQGGGFCGARTKPVPNGDLSAFDGVALRVKGDGSIFKLNIKTVRVRPIAGRWRRAVNSNCGAVGKGGERKARGAEEYRTRTAFWFAPWLPLASSANNISASPPI
jgi:hypothetical protein